MPTWVVIIRYPKGLRIADRNEDVLGLNGSFFAQELCLPFREASRGAKLPDLQSGYGEPVYDDLAVPIARRVLGFLLSFCIHNERGMQCCNCLCLRILGVHPEGKQQIVRQSVWIGTQKLTVMAISLKRP